MTDEANAVRHVVFPNDKGCCYWCLGVFTFKDLPAHFAKCKPPTITPKERLDRAQKFETGDTELQYRLTGVKYNEPGCSHVFLCGYCVNDPNKADKPHLIQNINLHWGQCHEAKVASAREKKNEQLEQLSNGDTTVSEGMRQDIASAY